MSTNIHDRILPLQSGDSTEGNEEREAFEALLPEARAIADDEIIRATTNTRTAVIRALATLSVLRTTLADASRVLPLWKPTTLDRFEQCAKALSHAQVRYLSGQSQNTNEFNEVAAECQRVLTLTLTDLAALANRNFVDAARVERIKDAGTSRDLLADRLRAAAELVREARAAVGDRAMVSERELAYIDSVADRMQSALVLRSKSASDALSNLRDRDRMFTLFHREYQHIRRTMDYVRFFEGDSDTLFPSIFTRGRRKDERETENEGEEEREDDKPIENTPGERASGGGVPQDDPFAPR